MKQLLIPFLMLATGIPAAGQTTIRRPDGRRMRTSDIDRTVQQLMDTAGVTGLCLAMIQDNRPVYVQAYGYRNKPLRQHNDTATCFYGASLSKVVFAYLVMRLVDQGIIDLDKPLFRYLPRPLPEYDNYKDLAGDERWKLLTGRHCLDHTTGFPNWRWFNPKGGAKLGFFFTPGQRYAYSGEGLTLLQFVIETITGRSLETLAEENVFKPLGMTRTSYVWQPSFENDYAVGHLAKGDTIPNKKRTKPNAAGSMETTIGDLGRFFAAVLRGEGLSATAMQQMLTPQVSIFSRRQFPSLDTATTRDNQAIRISYGLGWGLFLTPYGKACFKEGHDDGWGHFALCLPQQHAAVIVMTNSDNGESIFQKLFGQLADVTIPWQWENYRPFTATPRPPAHLQKSR